MYPQQLCWHGSPLCAHISLIKTAASIYLQHSSARLQLSCRTRWFLHPGEKRWRSISLRKVVVWQVICVGSSWDEGDMAAFRGRFREKILIFCCVLIVSLHENCLKMEHQCTELKAALSLSACSWWKHNILGTGLCTTGLYILTL